MLPEVSMKDKVLAVDRNVMAEEGEREWLR
jgi:hypothetical protein